MKRETQPEKGWGTAAWQGWLLAVVSGNTDGPFKSRKATEEITQENC